MRLKKGRNVRTHRRKRDDTYFTKAWPRSFFVHHDLRGKDDVPAVEAKAQLGGSQDRLANFLQESRDLGFPSEADEVKRLCRDISLEKIENGVGDAGTRRACWIDDRTIDNLTGCGKSRLSSWLTATGCLRYLRQPVWLNRMSPSYDQFIC